MRIFGPLEVHAADGRVVLPRAEDFRAFLVLLATSPTRRLDRDRLTRALWPDAGVQAAKARLRQLVFRARQLHPALDAALVTDRARVALAASEVRTDLDWLDEAERSTASDAIARELLERWHDEPLADLDGEWVRTMRAAVGPRLDALAERLISDLTRVDPRHPTGLALRERWSRVAWEPARVEALEARLGKGAAAPRLSTSGLPLIGRDEVLAELLDATTTLRPGTNAREIVVRGAPGVGKTRLAHELARRLRRRGQRVITIDASVGPRAPEGLVAELVLRQLGSPEAQRATSDEDVARAMRSAVGNTPLVLILDHVEHLEPVAAATMRRGLGASAVLVVGFTSAPAAKSHVLSESERIVSLGPLAPTDIAAIVAEALAEAADAADGDGDEAPRPTDGLEDVIARAASGQPGVALGLAWLLAPAPCSRGDGMRLARVVREHLEGRHGGALAHFAMRRSDPAAQPRDPCAAWARAIRGVTTPLERAIL